MTKLTVLLILASCLQSVAGARAQKITLDVKEVPLPVIFKEISRQTGLSVMFDEARMPHIHPVTLSVRDASVQEVLALCLRDQDLGYLLEDGIIMIRPQIPVHPAGDTSFLPQPSIKIEVHGTVFNEAGQPLAGTNVTVKETGKNTITNAKGEFSFQAVPNNSTLIISYIGYAAQQMKIKETSPLQIYLAITKDELDKVVIQAYGTTSRRLTTSNIGVVTAEEIEKQPVINPLQALQGRIAGLDINQTSGYASAPIKVELRGRSNINDAFPSDPLYIIDGVPLTVLEIGGNSNYQQGSSGFLQNDGLAGPAAGQSPFFSVNPADIQSIEVLKDADATAIYGSRGANGVILITTKKGKAGKTKFDLHLEEGINKVTRFWSMLNTPQYLAMRREGFKNDGITPDPSNAPDLLVWDTTRYTDWQKELYGGSGQYTDAQASLSGGDTRTTFRIGTGYHRQVGITRVSGSDQRGSFSFNLVHKSLNQKFSVALTSTYSFTRSDMISLTGYIGMPPNAPVIYDSAGNLNWAGWAPERSSFPFSNLKQPYVAKTTFLNSRLSLNYQPAKGLTVGASFGYNNAQSNQMSLIPIVSQDPNEQPKGMANFGNNSNKIWIVEPQITYDGFISKGKFSALVGASAQGTNTEGIYLQGTGYTSDDLLRTISNARTKYASDRYGEYRYAALFGRFTYNWDNKYLVNLSARRDGSSRFGEGNQFGNFASVGAAWIFTEEKWLKQHATFLSFGKLRGSYGTAGSDRVSEYQYLTRWSSDNLQPYAGIQPIQPTQHANPNIRWQLNRELEGALNLGILKDRFNFEFVYYRNRCGNQLVDFPLSAITGIGHVTANWAAQVQNDGWEFTLGGKIIESKEFTWSVNFNISINRNKLLSYPNFSLSPYVNTLVIGRSLNITKLLHYTGVDPQTGQYTFEDKNHDGKISNRYDSTGDRFVYDLNPKYYGGMGMNFSYKGIQLGIFFSGRKQIGVNAIAQGNNPGSMTNQPTGILDRWQKPGDRTGTARFTTQATQYDSYFNGNSDGGFTDASYLRLSNLSLSYELPARITRSAGMQGCTLFLHGQNILVITGYKGIDPETQQFGHLPPVKAVTAGLSFSF